MIDGYKTGFVTDPQGNRLLPITHINLVIDNDGRSILSIINQLDKRVFNVSTYEQMLSLNTSSLMNGAICFVDDLETYYSYTTSNGWEIMTTNGNGSGGQIEDIYSHIWIGPNPPEDDKNGKIFADFLHISDFFMFHIFLYCRFAEFSAFVIIKFNIF